MDDTTERIAPEIAPEFQEMATLCGCSVMQTKFAASLLAGENYTQAAWNAGYAGARDSVQLRTTGSQAARAKPVQALLALAESRGLAVSVSRTLPEIGTSSRRFYGDTPVQLTRLIR